MRFHLSKLAKAAPSLFAGTAIALAAQVAFAAESGFTETEIKIGGICPSTGPIASFVTQCAMQDAYFKHINERDGGVMMGDGIRRKINYIYYDDGYSPPRTVEQARRLVERDQVAAVVGPLGSATGLAIRDYLNRREVPQLFVGSGLSAFSTEVEAYPWTIGWQSAYTTEAAIFAEFLKSEKAGAKVAALYQNDDFGKELLNAFEHAAQGSGIELVSTQSYEVSSPTVDSQISNLAASGADTLLIFAVPKFAAQALRKVGETGWEPMVILTNISASKKTVLEPAGDGASEGVYSAVALMDPTSPENAESEDIKTYREIGEKYGSSALNLEDSMSMVGYGQAQTMVAVLEKTKEPSRASLMEAVRNTCDIPVMGLVQGSRVCVQGAEDPFFIETMQVVRYSEGRWKLVGDAITKYEGKTPRRAE